MLTSFLQTAIIMLLKHGRDGRDGIAQVHGCTVGTVVASTYVLCPHQQNWVIVNLGRQNNSERENEVQRFKLIINWSLAVELNSFL